MKKFRLIAAAMAAVMCISAVPVSAVQHGWESGEGTGRYILHDGAAATGVMNIDGVVYRFDPWQIHRHRQEKRSYPLLPGRHYVHRRLAEAFGRHILF